MVELKKWSVFTTPSHDGYTPPELNPSRLHGLAYGHPRFEDGVEIDTTRIMELSVDGDCIIARTRNTQYMLRRNTIDPRYEKAFPGAFDRIAGGILKNG